MEMLRGFDAPVSNDIPGFFSSKTSDTLRRNFVLYFPFFTAIKRRLQLDAMTLSGDFQRFAFAKKGEVNLLFFACFSFYGVICHKNIKRNR